MGERIAFEFKFNTRQGLGRGNYSAIGDVNPTRTFVVTPDGPSVAVAGGVLQCSLDAFLVEHAGRFVEG